MKHTTIAALALTLVFVGYQQVSSMDDKMEKPMEKMVEKTARLSLPADASGARNRISKKSTA